MISIKFFIIAIIIAFFVSISLLIALITLLKKKNFENEASKPPAQSEEDVPAEFKKPILICGFPGVGKTYVFEHQKELGIKVKDSDSSRYGKNETWVKNYIKDIKEELKENLDYIFISTHKEVVSELIKNKIKFFVVYPNRDLKQEWTAKLMNRADDDITKVVKERFGQFISDLESKKSPYKIDIRLTSEKTNLSDVIQMIEKR